MTLRPYQSKALEAIKTKLQSGTNRQLLKLPTGTGKTVVFASIPDFFNFKNRMLVLVHREELASQAADKLRKWNPSRSVGVEMADQSSNGEDLVVGSVQTLGRNGSKRIEKFNPSDFDVIVVDEAHHCLGQTYQNVLNHFRVVEDTHRLCLGVTATVNRADGRGLNTIFQEITFDMGMLQGITEGWLVDLRGMRIATNSSLDEVRTLAGDFNLGDLTDAINHPQRNDLIARTWLANGEDRSTVAFCVDVQHAKDLAHAFKQYGVACEALWGGDPDRAAKLKAHRDGHLKVLVNCMVLSEGYDDPAIGCIILARPTKSETLYVQAVGRGSRIPEGINNLVEAKKAGIPLSKEDCIVMDFVDVTSKHSLVSLPSLFGMNKDMDMRGKKVTTVMQELADVQKAKAFIDLSKVVDINKLKAYAEAVDLFKVGFSPEVIQFSEFQWHKTGEEQYLLALQNNDSLRITHDLLDHWRVTGLVLGLPIDGTHTSFSEAIKAADELVRKMGNGSTTLLKRDAKWHADPPTLVQITTCRKFHLAIPEGATKGDVAKKLNKMFLDMKLAAQARAARKVG